ncbi:lipoprotein [Barrientosiimonas marina]|uniref:Lipoprotein n=1 Tax=Lentibacillus kimchii TaxID=1542911 RepID=A0ABW2V0X1_9BACI
MKKLLAWLSPLLLAMLIVGCSDQSAAGATKDDDQSSGKKQADNAKTIEYKITPKSKSILTPYQAIEPPEDAKPFKERYSEKVRKKMPHAEAHGGDPDRTVPLGQTLLKGKEDKTNGPLKDHRLVAYYGTPNSEHMGVLGEMPPEEMMEELKEKTRAYSKADPSHPAVPMIELISTVAQRKPGESGDYITDTPDEDIERYAKLAKEHGALLLLDVQLGRAPVMKEVKKLKPYLKLPYVHLAIDTEYSVDEGEIPGEDLGQVDGSEIQKAVEYVNDLVEENHLPDKMVLVHQFGNGVVQNKDKINPTEHVEVPLNYDGFGDPAIKMSAYGKLVRKQGMQYGGFKLFYQNDDPLLKPKQVLKLDPAPAVINYQ